MGYLLWVNCHALANLPATTTDNPPPPSPGSDSRHHCLSGHKHGNIQVAPWGPIALTEAYFSICASCDEKVPPCSLVCTVLLIRLLSCRGYSMNRLFSYSIVDLSNRRLIQRTHGGEATSMAVAVAFAACLFYSRYAADRGVRIRSMTAVLGGGSSFSSRVIQNTSDACWQSSRHFRWRVPHQSMSLARQKELIEEYVEDLPALPCGLVRSTQSASCSEQRDRCFHLSPSSELPSLQAVYVAADGARSAAGRPIAKQSHVLNYPGWLLTEAEYERFGYAVHTAVGLPHRTDDTDSSTRYVLMGDPTAPAVQINCINGTRKRANVQLTVSSRKRAKSSCADSSEMVSLPVPYVTIRAQKTLRPGDELWLDYGRMYWQHMSLYCPRCLEYGANAQDRMLLCEVDGCKRAWHQLCLSPCLVEVPDGPFYCDIHTSHQQQQPAALTWKRRSDKHGCRSRGPIGTIQLTQSLSDSPAGRAGRV